VLHPLGLHPVVLPLCCSRPLLPCTLLHCTLLHCTLLCRTLSPCIPLPCTRIALHSLALHSVALLAFALYYVALHSGALQLVPPVQRPLLPGLPLLAPSLLQVPWAVLSRLRLGRSLLQVRLCLLQLVP